MTPFEVPAGSSWDASLILLKIAALANGGNP